VKIRVANRRQIDEISSPVQEKYLSLPATAHHSYCELQQKGADVTARGGVMIDDDNGGGGYRSTLISVSRNRDLNRSAPLFARCKSIAMPANREFPKTL